MPFFYQVSVGPVVMGTGFGRTDPCLNPRNTLGRGMEPNHPELGLDPDVARRVNQVQTPKKIYAISLSQKRFVNTKQACVRWKRDNNFVLLFELFRIFEAPLL